ncbi:hypothetical protein ABUW04_31895 [Streptacidiphilus sp. N1-10]|uniref:Uncharacterized protein n=1 Tax=Streptacidiphilus jeojiensis TaxID=3229225 RepID=A0ABV6XXL9_9ACTN
MLPPQASWLRTLRTQGLFVVSGHINRLYLEAADALDTDQIWFVDPELHKAEIACRESALQLRRSMLLLLVVDRIENTKEEHPSPSQIQDAATLVIREPLRGGEEEKRLYDLRDAFFDAYDRLIRLLNESRLLPGQAAAPERDKQDGFGSASRSSDDGHGIRSEPTLRWQPRRSSFDNPPHRPHFMVGGGEPSQQHAFTELFNALTPSVLGLPCSDVQPSGAVFVQHFERSWSTDPMVICARPNGAAVAMPGSVLGALQTAGGGTHEGNGVSLIGLPSAATCSNLKDRIVVEESDCIQLDGGTWGAGQLSRASSRQPWRWDPAPAMDFNQTRNAENWTVAPAPDLRIRVLATFPFADSNHFVISPERRQELIEKLSFSHIAQALTILSQRRGADLPARTWTRGSNGNDLNSANYVCQVSMPDSPPALSAEVMITARHSTVITCAEVRLEDAGTWSKALHRSSKRHQFTRLTLEEIKEVLFSAWTTAAETLPAAVLTSQSTPPWAAVPTVELRIKAEKDHSGAPPSLNLSELLDLTPLGTTDRHQLNVFAITINTSPSMNDASRRALLEQALDHMRQGYGFIDPHVAWY